MTTERGPERVEEAQKEPWVVTISDSVETALFAEEDGDRYFVARMTEGQHPLVTGYGDTREQAYHQLVDAMHALIGCLTDDQDRLRADLAPSGEEPPEDVREALNAADRLYSRAISPDDGGEPDKDLATIRRALSGGGWRPIETAPRDGTEVVVIGKIPGGDRLRACVSRWYGTAEESPWAIQGWAYSVPGFVDLISPTHWMPLPTPPEPQEESRAALGPFGCKCQTLAQRAVGAGCDICQPQEESDG